MVGGAQAGVARRPAERDVRTAEPVSARLAPGQGVSQIVLAHRATVAPLSGPQIALADRGWKRSI